MMKKCFKKLDFFKKAFYLDRQGKLCEGLREITQTRKNVIAQMLCHVMSDNRQKFGTNQHIGDTAEDLSRDEQMQDPIIYFRGANFAPLHCKVSFRSFVYL